MQIPSYLSLTITLQGRDYDLQFTDEEAEDCRAFPRVLKLADGWARIGIQVFFIPKLFTELCCHYTDEGEITK